MLRVNINQRPYTFDHSTTILEACTAAKVQVPALCHDSRLKPYGGCRLCMVDVEGWDKPATACATAVQDGMEIRTNTPELESLRKSLLRMLARDYPKESIRRFPDKEFHRLLHSYGLSEEAVGLVDANLVDDCHPYIAVDFSRCIYCFRCVRICEEVQGQSVWKVWYRGDQTRILPDSGTTLRDSSCVSCGACVDTCPTGALEDKQLIQTGVPTSWTRTTCPYCGTGCEMMVGSKDGRIVSAKPVLDAPVSKGHLCVKGRYAFGFVHAPDRVTSPMIRKNGEWCKVDWQEAISFVADKLQFIASRYGPDAIGVLGSARATNEDNYLTQKFARVVLGTNNVDCCARVCHAPTAAAMKHMLGTGAATNSFDDIELARTILVCGANATENHPIVGARIKQATLGGARLIVIDPRKIELADYATVYLPIRPGTNVPLLNAMACAIVEQNLCDLEFISKRVSEFEEYLAFIKSWTPERLSEICGVKADEIRSAARIYASVKPALAVHGLGVTEHTQGTEGVMCLVNLALLTGNIGRPGTGINPLRGQNNVQGSAHMGCDPNHLTGYVPIQDARASFENVWRIPIPSATGMNLMQMMDAGVEGKLKAIWAIGYDIHLTNANAQATAKALDAMDIVIVQDMFLNETARNFGTVFLPVASSFEKEGTFMNAERRVQLVRKVIDPVGESKPDWQIICEIARAMGKGEYFAFSSPEEIWNEIRSVWKAGGGITYSRIENGGLQWPCPTEDHPGTKILHQERFPIGERAALQRIDYRSTQETTSEEYPFLLVTGRTLLHFNAGTMTFRTENRELRPGDFLDISPTDASRLQLQDGKEVLLRSRYGKTRLPLRITDSVKPGELFATFHTAQAFLNRVTSPFRDAHVQSPEYKVTAVNIQELKES